MDASDQWQISGYARRQTKAPTARTLTGTSAAIGTGIDHDTRRAVRVRRRRRASTYDRQMREPAITDDGRYIVVNDRRWRATDPLIPEERRVELVRILMAWRREVRRAKGTAEESEARAGVHAAKVALGERGDPPWWDQDEAHRRARWQVEVAEPR
jgi:hypothetical protein